MTSTYSLPRAGSARGRPSGAIAWIEKQRAELAPNVSADAAGTPAGRPGHALPPSGSAAP